MKQIKIPLYLCLFFLLILGIAAIKSLFDQPITLTNVERIVQIRDDSISYWKDKYGKEHAEKQLAKAELGVLKIAYAPLIDSVLKALDINKRQLESIAAIGISSKGNGKLKVDTLYVDSSLNYAFQYADNWIQLSGKIGAGNSFSYTSFDSIIISTYYKRHGLFKLGSKEVLINAYSLNPNSKISGLTGLQVAKVRRMPIGIGIQAGYGFTGNSFTPYLGVGIQYSIIRF